MAPLISFALVAFLFHSSAAGRTKDETSGKVAGLDEAQDEEEVFGADDEIEKKSGAHAKTEEEYELDAGDKNMDFDTDQDGNLVASDNSHSGNPITAIFKHCRGYCVSCDGENEFWHVKRGKTGIHKLAVAATVAGILATGGLAGGVVLAHGLAGAVGNLFVIGGIKMTSAAIAGLTGASFLTYNLITRNVDCPRLDFIEMHKFPPQPEGGENGTKAPSPKEMRYSLEDVFFEELASQMEDVGGNMVMETPRQKMSKDRRLESLFACAVLKNSKVNLSSVSVLMPTIGDTLGKYENIFEAMVAKCADWLCMKPPEEVKKISRLSVAQCDGAHVFTGRWWKRAGRSWGLR